MCKHWTFTYGSVSNYMALLPTRNELLYLTTHRWTWVSRSRTSLKIKISCTYSMSENVAFIIFAIGNKPRTSIMNIFTIQCEIGRQRSWAISP